MFETSPTNLKAFLLIGETSLNQKSRVNEQLETEGILMLTLYYMGSNFTYFTWGGGADSAPTSKMVLSGCFWLKSTIVTKRVDKFWAMK